MVYSCGFKLLQHNGEILGASCSPWGSCPRKDECLGQVHEEGWMMNFDQDGSFQKYGGDDASVIGRLYFKVKRRNIVMNEGKWGKPLWRNIKKAKAGNATCCVLNSVN